MAVEIEAKMKVPDLSPLRERLRTINAQFLSRVAEINTFLDYPDGRMTKGGKGLRVRVNRNLWSNEETNVVTYKGPLQKGPMKTREEREVTVESHDDMVEVFQGIGLSVHLSFEKRRESWNLDACKVELDELPQLGTFVEIEGPNEEAVAAVREKLGLANEPMIKEGYASMIAKLLLTHGGGKELRFS